MKLYPTVHRTLDLFAITVAAAVLSLPHTTAKAPQPAATPELTARPADKVAPLFEGLGTHTRKITTTSPDARRYFDQGLTWAYSFNHDEAIRSFEQAAAFDPGCAKKPGPTRTPRSPPAACASHPAKPRRSRNH